MGGFGVASEGLRAVRDLLELAAADLSAVRGAWDGATRDLGAAFATADCGRSFSQFQQHLFDSLGSRRQVLTGLASALEDSAATYIGADGAESHQFGGLGSGSP